MAILKAEGDITEKVIKLIINSALRENGAIGWRNS